jgi:O-antigen ligase
LRSSRQTSPLEILAAIHAGVVIVVASWALGGNIAWARPLLSILGSLGLVLTVAAVVSRLRSERASLRPLHLLWPLLGYNALVLLSTLQPSFRAGIIYDAEVLVPVASLTSWPSTARPAETLRQLWLFNALFLPAFNLFLCVRTRRTLRTLLLVLAGNALALAIFGSVQKLTGASGLFFGAVASPNRTFFASFIYHNHWGAFLLLMLAASLGLVFHHALRPGARDFWHSPAFLGLVGSLLLAATAPLSTSRSSSVLCALLLGIALLDGLRRLLRRRSRENRSHLAPVFALVVAGLLAACAIFDLARPIIAARTADTREQLAVMRAQGGIGSRATLYADTWRMAADRPWFGWGLGSYPPVFQRYNSQRSVDGLPMFYVDAHSDWLQSLAETGFTGTSLLGLLVLLPLATTLRHRPGPLPAYLIAGCGLVLLYAWIEFPFGCPAVIAVFWVTLFSAARIAQLDAHDRPKPADTSTI